MKKESISVIIEGENILVVGEQQIKGSEFYLEDSGASNMSYSDFTELLCEVNIVIINNLSCINKMQICYNVTPYFSVHKLDSRQHRKAELKVLPVWNDLVQRDLTFSISSIKGNGKKVEKTLPGSLGVGRVIQRRNNNIHTYCKRTITKL